METSQRYWACCTKASRALQNNLSKIYIIRKHSYGENFKLNVFMCAQTKALGTHWKFQLENPIRSTTSAIHKFREIICETSWPFVQGIHWSPVTKASDAGLWYLLWSTREQTVGQTMGTPIIWDAIAFIMTPGPWFNIRWHLTSIGNPIVGIRRSYDRLISTMGFPILVRWHLYIESGSSVLGCPCFEPRIFMALLYVGYLVMPPLFDKK